jgi:RNA polymerase sigma-70 factor (ECF subfamily)
MEDKLLVNRCKRGSKDALGRIYEKYKDDLLILAIALLNETSAAEDVLHDVFVTFVQGIEKFRLTGSLKGYLLTCVANRARNINKAKYQQNTDLDDAELVVTVAKGPHQSTICNEELQQLSSALAQLSYEQREIIILRLHGGISFREIAGQQGISNNTLKSRYRYGIEKLRSILNGEKE